MFALNKISLHIAEAPLPHDPNIMPLFQVPKDEGEQIKRFRSFWVRLTAAGTTCVQLRTRLRKCGPTIGHFEADRRWLAEHEQDEREEKERILKEREGEDVHSKTESHNSTNNLKTEADRDVRSLCSELSTLKEDYVDLQDRLDALSHTTSQNLATQAAELTFQY
ncbi:hypothetical protein H4582DRAFT_2079406 [Lactarius indigo]|nr:hypothetical protein H4582DRAFT_2079402 [Lactarius indigo]KAI9435781.1 hypothetical protein H4582DRAFT_2079406 [Lactarius indigo]